LKGAGLGKGDRVVVQTTQTIAYFAAILGAQLAGCISVPLETNAADLQYEEIVRITGAKCCIGFDAGQQGVLAVSHTEVLAHPTGQVPEVGTLALPDAGDVAEILFTTGTTGKSKGVVCSHGACIAVAQNVACGVHMKPGNREIVPGPYNHTFSLRRCYANLYNGSAVVIIDGVIFANRFFDALTKHGVTSMALLPAFVSILFQLSGKRLGDFKDCLDYVQVGGSIFARTDKARLCALLPHTRIYDFYGCTEAGCACTFDCNAEKARIDTVGLPAVNAVFRFVDEEGDVVPGTKEHPAFIAIGGGMLMQEYFGEPELTAQTVKDGFVVTKDLGYRDDEGYIHVIGRQDDVINMGGNKIAPAEIEDAAIGCDGVVAAACIAMDDRMFGQVPKLFIVTEGSGPFDVDVFGEQLARRIDGSKLPKSIVEIDALPTTYNGKLSRKALRDMVQAGEVH
jgi:long-chain acyl-CoA synthetase